MEEAGAIAINRSAVSEISKGIIHAKDLDVTAMGFQSNDLIIGRQIQLPFVIPDLYTQGYTEHSIPGTSWISLMNHDLDSGYYASIYGDLPYRLIRQSQTETFYSYTVKLTESP